MWNFGIPPSLKAWVDFVVRPGKTFVYAENGVLGLAKDKRAILVLASGGVFTEGPWTSWDFVEPYLRRILSFIGIESRPSEPRARISHRLQLMLYRTQKRLLRGLLFKAGDGAIYGRRDE
jgi:putative NADPH-quinone reductase